MDLGLQTTQAIEQFAACKPFILLFTVQYSVSNCCYPQHPVLEIQTLLLQTTNKNGSPAQNKIQIIKNISNCVGGKGS